MDFLTELPCYLENVGEHCYGGDVVVTGNLDGLSVSVSRYQMKVKDGSLCNGIWATITGGWGEAVCRGRLKSCQTHCTCLLTRQRLHVWM